MNECLRNLLTFLVEKLITLMNVEVIKIGFFHV